jgi:hypothetical protein
MAIIIRRLEERDEVENFDCGDEPLNNYLKRHAWSNQRKSSIGISTGNRARYPSRARSPGLPSR